MPCTRLYGRHRSVKSYRGRYDTAYWAQPDDFPGALSRPPSSDVAGNGSIQAIARFDRAVRSEDRRAVHMWKGTAH